MGGGIGSLIMTQRECKFCADWYYLYGGVTAKEKKSMKASIFILSGALLLSGATVALAQSSDSKSAGTDMKDGAKDVGHGVDKGAKATAHGTKTVAKDTAHGTKVAAKDTAHGTKVAAKDTGHAVDKGAKATAHGTKKVGHAIVHPNAAKQDQPPNQ